METALLEDAGAEHALLRLCGRWALRRRRGEEPRLVRLRDAREFGPGDRTARKLTGRELAWRRLFDRPRSDEDMQLLGEFCGVSFAKQPGGWWSVAPRGAAPAAGRE